MSKYQCCGTDHPHCHCRGDKGHNILPGCPGYVGPCELDHTPNEATRAAIKELIDGGSK